MPIITITTNYNIVGRSIIILGLIIKLWSTTLSKKKKWRIYKKILVQYNERSRPDPRSRRYNKIIP